jgi:DNA-binding Xre family transcriptional regulator
MNKERLTIKATPQGLSKARKAILRMGYGSKANFAQSIGLGRTTVTKFFQRKPLEYDSFTKICDHLKLKWQDIVEPSDLDETADNQPQEQAFEEQNLSTDIDVLVQDIREKIRDTIKKRCGTMRVLDMTQPIGLNDIYTDVNILEKITGRRRIDLPELVQRFDPDSEDFNRYEMGQVAEKRVPGIKAVNRYSKLMILGKPGAGKTTFLKYLAIQCIDGDFQANRVPIFITLKQFAEDDKQENIMNFVSSFIAEQGVTPEEIYQALIYGRLLFLFDGLDEVKEEDSERVIRQIGEFASRFSYSRFLKEDSDELTKNILDKFKGLFCNACLKWLNELNNDLANRGFIINKIRASLESFSNEENNYSIEVLNSFIDNINIDEFKDNNLTKYFIDLNKLVLEQFQNLRRPEYLKWLETENFRGKNKLLKYIKSLLSKYPNEDHKNLINLLSKSLQKFINKELEDDALSFKNSILSKLSSNEIFINNYLK